MCERMTRIAERVRQIREAKGLSMQYVADVLSIGQSTLSRYERGKLKLDAELLPRLGEALRVDPCLFLADAKSAQAPQTEVEPAAFPTREDREAVISDDASLAVARLQELLAGKDVAAAHVVLDFLQWRKDHQPPTGTPERGLDGPHLGSSS